MDKVERKQRLSNQRNHDEDYDENDFRSVASRGIRLDAMEDFVHEWELPDVDGETD